MNSLIIVDASTRFEPNSVSMAKCVLCLERVRIKGDSLFAWTVFWGGDEKIWDCKTGGLEAWTKAREEVAGTSGKLLETAFIACVGGIEPPASLMFVSDFREVIPLPRIRKDSEVGKWIGKCGKVGVMASEHNLTPAKAWAERLGSQLGIEVAIWSESMVLALEEKEELGEEVRKPSNSQRAAKRV